MTGHDLAAVAWAILAVFAFLSVVGVVAMVRELRAEIRDLREAREAARPDVFARPAAERPEVARRWTA